jgi:uncharacterized protein YqfB (UPF0267 family)
MANEEAVPLAAYSIIAASENKVRPPSDCSAALPKRYKKGAAIGKQVSDFIHANSCSRINAIRLFLRLARTVPGFGVQKFSTSLVSDDDHVTSLAALVSPYGLTMVTDSGDTYMKATFSNIVETSTENEVLTISVLANRQIATSNFQTRHAEEIAYLICEYQRIIREIQSERAALRKAGKWKGPSTTTFDVVNLLSVYGFDIERG